MLLVFFSFFLNSNENGVLFKLLRSSIYILVHVHVYPTPSILLFALSLLSRALFPYPHSAPFVPLVPGPPLPPSLAPSWSRYTGHFSNLRALRLFFLEVLYARGRGNALTCLSFFHLDAPLRKLHMPTTGVMFLFSYIIYF